MPIRNVRVGRVIGSAGKLAEDMTLKQNCRPPLQIKRALNPRLHLRHRLDNGRLALQTARSRGKIRGRKRMGRHRLWLQQR